jgi:phosphoribosylaminoimidazole-succinocarboxamide synthase
MTDEFVQLVSERYIELFEQMSGQEFVKAHTANVTKRIETNVLDYLKKEA